MTAASWLLDPILTDFGVAHGFGLRGLGPPPGLLRPRQVHGCEVWQVTAASDPPPAADAVVSGVAGVPVGIVTADCVPVLLAAEHGTQVAAVHAGWRGLVRGVVAAGVRALVALGSEPGRMVAAIGPHIGPCCYEVDAPVLDAVQERFGSDAERATRPARPGHAMLDLGRLVAVDLARSGLSEAAVGRTAATCTCCNSGRFDSYRRNGPRAGRLYHFVVAGRPPLTHA